MKKIFLITILLSLLLIPGLSLAQVDGLQVNFEQEPLFQDANFLPGYSVDRWIEVTNNSGQPQRIAMEAINISDPNNFGQFLAIEIKESSDVVYDGLLADFYNGEVYLSDLSTGNTTQYDFKISFQEGAEDLQGAVLGFDILVGFQGVEGGVSPGTSPGSGGGGSSSVSGLQINQEGAVYISDTTAVITWLTSYSATSRVVYSNFNEPHFLDLADTQDDPSLYGYENTTSEFDTPASENGVTFHQITLNNLEPNTTYYFRCISHASPPTIGREQRFTTLALEEGDSQGQSEENNFLNYPDSSDSFDLDQIEIGESFNSEEETKEKEGEMSKKEEEQIENKKKQAEEDSERKNPLLAGIANLLSSGTFWILLGLVLLALATSIAIRKRKNKNQA